MQQLRTIDPAALAHLSRALVGFDQVFNQRLQQANGNYPPHNIVQLDDTHFVIEVAVAGFKETEIEVEVSNIDKIEETIIGNFVEKNPSEFNKFLSSLINSFSLEKQEDEKSVIFESRLLIEINKIFDLK